jgi:hypothetical protein
VKSEEQLQSALLNPGIHLMFHTYVRAYSGNLVDIDRASLLMDKELLDQSIQAMEIARSTPPDEFDLAIHARMSPGVPYFKFSAAQWVWEHYCELHRERYGTPFEPNINPHWDCVKPAEEQQPRRQRTP